MARGAGDDVVQRHPRVPPAGGVNGKHVPQESASPPGPTEWHVQASITRPADGGVKERRPAACVVVPWG